MDEETNPQNEQPGQPTPETETNEQSTSQDQATSSRRSQRSKKKPNWYGQDVMVSKVEEGEKVYKEQAQSETKSERIRRKLEEMPNFLEMSQEEIEEWINN